LAAVALVGIGAGLLFTHRTGRRIWPILVGAALTLGLLGHSASSAIQGRFGSSLGAHTVTPRTLTDLQTDYRVAAGALRLDLAGVPFVSGQTKVVRLDVGAGALNVTVPRNIVLDVRAQDSVGAVNVLGHRLGSGFGVDQEWHQEPAVSSELAPAHLVLDLDVGFGAVNVSYGGDGIPPLPAPPTPPTVPTPPTAPPVPVS
ncbi:MAG TPA: hypothetical protein VGR90_10495, partial [Acidimicrobiales bacterium]|nr:hypothetical protein [Acidimicrobiales bacterium]